jgi:hypothetical protein
MAQHNGTHLCNKKTKYNEKNEFTKTTHITVITKFKGEEVKPIKCFPLEHRHMPEFRCSVKTSCIDPDLYGTESWFTWSKEDIRADAKGLAFFTE